MGAAFRTMDVAGNKTRNEVEALFEQEQEQDRYENGHSYSGGFGMATGLSFPAKTFEGRDSAYDWLSDNCRKWEDAQAVTYRDKDGTQWLIAAWCAE